MIKKIGQKKVWDSIAKAWHGYRQQPWKDVEKLMILLSEGKPRKILDIGCGNGRNLLEFARKGFECYGIDFSEEMLRHAVELSKKNDVKLRLKYGLAEHIPFMAGSFDYSLCIAVLHHLKKDNQPIALKEIHRVLRKNGKAVISVWNKFNPKFWKYLLRKEAIIPWKFENEEYGRYYYFFNYFELRSMLKKAGFRIIKASSPFSRNLSFVVRKISD